jgi:hypothetical protein
MEAHDVARAEHPDEACRGGGGVRATRDQDEAMRSLGDEGAVPHNPSQAG